MSQFSCKYCGRPMTVNFIEYRSNSFCNTCFNERAATNPIKKGKRNTFEFMGDVISLPKTHPKKTTR